VVVVSLLDVFSKIAVVRLLGPDSDRHEVQILSTLIQFNYAENSGIAFGLLRGNPVVVWTLVLLAMLGMMALVWRTLASATWQIAVAIGLVAGGGLANLIDRFADGYVLDFISLWRWPSFNIADAFITIGVITLLVLIIRQERAEAQ